MPPKSKKADPTCYAVSLKKKKGYEPSEDVFEAVVDDAPICKGCNAPMSPFAIYHAHPERLPLTKHKALGVFVCAREPGEDWDDWWEQCSPGNPSSVDGRRAVLYEVAPTLKKKGKAGYYAQVVDVDPEVKEELEDEDEDERPPVGFYEYDGCKLGGSPRYVGGGDAWDAPKCPKCKKTMKFMAQIGSTEGLKFDSGDGFVGHVYVCPTEQEATLQVVYA